MGSCVTRSKASLSPDLVCVLRKGGWKRGKNGWASLYICALLWCERDEKYKNLFCQHACRVLRQARCLETIKKRARGGYICNSNPLLFSEAVFILVRACMCLGIFYRHFSSTSSIRKTFSRENARFSLSFIIAWRSWGRFLLCVYWLIARGAAESVRRQKEQRHEKYANGIVKKQHPL